MISALSVVAYVTACHCSSWGSRNFVDAYGWGASDGGNREERERKSTRFKLSEIDATLSSPARAAQEGCYMVTQPGCSTPHHDGIDRFQPSGLDASFGTHFGIQTLPSLAGSLHVDGSNAACTKLR